MYCVVGRAQINIIITVECVFFPFILDIKFVGRTSRGHTGGRTDHCIHTIIVLYKSSLRGSNRLHVLQIPIPLDTPHIHIKIIRVTNNRVA